MRYVCLSEIAIEEAPTESYLYNILYFLGGNDCVDWLFTTFFLSWTCPRRGWAGCAEHARARTRAHAR